MPGLTDMLNQALGSGDGGSTPSPTPDASQAAIPGFSVSAADTSGGTAPSMVTTDAAQAPAYTKVGGEAEDMDLKKKQYLLEQTALQKMGASGRYISARMGDKPTDDILKGQTEADYLKQNELTPEEKTALNARDARLADLSAKQAQADAESSVPAAAKPFLNVANGIGDAVANVSDLINMDENRTASKDSEAHPTYGGAGGAFLRSSSQFLTGFIAAGQALKIAGIAQGVGTGAAIGRTALQGATAQGIGSDPYSPHLANLMESSPALSNPITKFLAADPNDPEALARLKNGIEGLVVGVVGEGLFKAVTGLKASYLARAAGDDTASARILADTHEQVLQSYGRAGKVTPLPAQDAEAAAAPATESPAPTGNTPAPAGTVPAPEGMTSTEVAAHDATPPGELPSELKDYLTERIANPTDAEPIGVAHNLDKLVADNGVKNALDLMSEAMAPEIQKARGGVQNLQTISRMAGWLGVDADELHGQVAALASFAPKQAAILEAGEKLMLHYGQRIADTAASVKAGVAAPEALSDLYNKFGELVTNLHAIKAGAGRTLYAARGMTEPFTEGELNQLVASGGNPGVLRAIVQPRTLGQKVGGTISESFVNGILSNPATDVKVGVSGILNATLKPIQRILGGVVKTGLGRAGGPQDVTDGINLIVGGVKGVADSMRMAAAAFKVDSGAVLDSAKGLLGNDSVPAISSAGYGLDPQGIAGKAADWIGTTLRLPTRLLTSVHEFTKQVLYRSDVYSKLAAEAAQKGLQGDELAKFMDDGIKGAFDENGAATRADSLEYARNGTFTQQTPDFINRISQLSNSNPLTKSIIPFVKVPYNVTSSAVDNSLPFLKSSFYEDLKAGGSRQADALGRLTTASGVLTLAALGVHHGMITGGGPKDPELRRSWLQSHQPYSIWTGSGWLSYQAAEPVSMVVGTVADYADAAAHLDPRKVDQHATAIAGAMAQNLLSKTFMKGIADFVDALHDPVNALPRYLREQVAAAIPFSGLLKNARDQFDPIRREVNSVWGAMKNTIPGASSSLPAQRNLFGEPVYYPPGFNAQNTNPFIKTVGAVAENTLSPFHYMPGVPDDVANELARLQHGFEVLPNSINNVPITPQQRDRWGELIRTYENNGQTLKQAMTKMVQSPQYKALPDDVQGFQSQRMQILQGLVGAYRHATQAKLIQENPDLKAKIPLGSSLKAHVKALGSTALSDLEKLQQ